jgi:prephenate dehydratase
MPEDGPVTPIKVGYQGEPGAYSDEAAQLLFPEASSQGYPTFAAVFTAVTSSELDAAVLPVENSLAGVVQEVNDLLWDNPQLAVVAEHVAPIRHHLLSRDGTAVTRALSHPQALAQCAGWLRSHGITPVAFHDTAGAAREVAAHGKPGDGALASRAAADRYGLTVVASEVADDISNRTRFLVVRPRLPQASALMGSVKLSLGFVAEHRPGGLAAVLDVFARSHFNLTRLDSRPIPQQPFRYRFYADVELPEAGQVEPLLTQLRTTATELRPFGHFPPATISE